MAITNLVNNSVISAPGAITLPNVTYPVASAIAASAGGAIVYTCPAGRRALVMFGSMRNTNASSNSIFLRWKIGSVTYNMKPINLNVPATGIYYDPDNAGFIMEGTDVLIWGTSLSGLSVWNQIIEFDNTASLKTVRLIGLISGINTIYTCPVGKQALIVSGDGLPFGSTNNGSIFVSAQASISSVQINIVPNGGSPALSNQVMSAPITTGFAMKVKFRGVLSPGDSVVMQGNFASSTSMACVNILEF